MFLHPTHNHPVLRAKVPRHTSISTCVHTNFAMNSFAKAASPLSKNPRFQPITSRPSVSPMAHRLPSRTPLQMRRHCLLKSVEKRSAGAENKLRLSSFEERMHKILSGECYHPLHYDENCSPQNDQEHTLSPRHQTEGFVQCGRYDDVDNVKLAKAAPSTAAVLKPTKSLVDVMANVVAYVEYRCESEDRSASIKSVIAGMGAKVNDRLIRTTTHVVFKDGLQSTYDKAMKLHVPIVSLLWVEACRKQMCLADPKDFIIYNAHRYDNPEQYPKIKKFKSAFPIADKSRRRHTLCAPIPAGDVPCTDAIELSVRTVASTTKPVLLSTAHKAESAKKVSDNLVNARRSLFLDHKMSDAVHVTAAVPPVPLVPQNQRQITMCVENSTTPLRNINKTPQSPVHASPPLQNERKRRGTPLLNSVLIKRAMGTPQVKHEDAHEVVDELPVAVACVTLNRRRTLFTPNKVVELRANKSNKAITNNNKIETVVGASCSVKPIHTNGSDDENLAAQSNSPSSLISSFNGLLTASPATPPFSGLPLATPTTVCKTPASSANRRKTIYEEYTSSFSSTRTPASRRTIFDVSMDILNQRIQNINRIIEAEAETKRNQNPDIASGYTVPDADEIDSIVNAKSPDSTKRRKLYTPPGGVRQRLSLNDDSDCFIVEANEEETVVELEPILLFEKPPQQSLAVVKQQKQSVEMAPLRSISEATGDDAEMGKAPTPKRPRLAALKKSTVRTTPVTTRRRSAMFALN